MSAAQDSALVRYAASPYFRTRSAASAPDRDEKFPDLKNRPRSAEAEAAWQAHCVRIRASWAAGREKAKRNLEEERQWQ